MIAARIWRASLPALLVLGVASRDIRVDDADSSISYSPPDQWSQGAQCADCTIRPDPDHTFKGTWHDSTYSPSPNEPLRLITFSFTGTAVSVFNILPGADPSAPTTHVDLTFELDGDSMGGFTYDPSGNSFQYDKSVFSVDQLANTSHKLVIQTTSGVLSVVLFDYIVYTVPDPPVSTSTTTSTTSTTSTSSSTSSDTLPTISSISSSSSSQSTASSTSSLMPTSLSLSSSTALSALLPVLSASQPLASPALSSQPEEHTRSIGASLQSSSGTQITTSVIPNRQQDASTSSTVPTGAVIGGAVGGGILLLLLLAVLVYLLCIRRARRFRTADEIGSPGADKPLDDERSRLSRTRRWTFLDSRETRASLLLPPSPSVIAIGDPYSSASDFSCSSAQSIGETVVATGLAGPPLPAHRPESLGQETTEKAALASDGDGDAPRGLTLPGTPHSSGEPDAGVLERLAALQEEMASIRARQVQVETVALLTAGAPPSYNEA